MTRMPRSTDEHGIRVPESVAAPIWNHAVFTFGATTAGSYQMVMNVGNIGNEVYASASFFSGHSISPNPVTPEAGTLPLVGTGVLGLAGAVCRKINI